MDALTEIIEEKDEAGKWLVEFFKSKSPTDKQIRQARIATSHRSTQVRAQSTAISKEKAKFTLARLITDDLEERKKYLDISVPKQPRTD